MEAWMSFIEYLLLGAIVTIVAGFVGVLVWKLWMTPVEYTRIKAAAARAAQGNGNA
jgi:hypothetical protein